MAKARRAKSYFRISQIWWPRRVTPRSEQHVEHFEQGNATLVQQLRADACDVESREWSASRGLREPRQKLQMCKRRRQHTGNCSVVGQVKNLPGRGSGTRCGAEGGTRWKNRWWPGRTAQWSAAGSSGSPPGSHLVPAWRDKQGAPVTEDHEYYIKKEAMTELRMKRSWKIS